MKIRVPVMVAAAALLGSTAFTGSAWAGAGDDCCDDIEDLQRQILLLQAQIDELKGKSVEMDHSVSWKGAPLIEGKGNKFKVRGRLMVDFVHQDGDVGTFFDPDDAEPFTTGTEFRRARLGVEGELSKKTSYKFEIDFADNNVSIKDAYITQKFGPAAVNVGQFKTPNSLDELTSSRYSTFMERTSFTEGFGFDRQIGVGINFGDDNWSAALGAFGNNARVQAPNATTSVYEELWALAARLSFAPINEEGKLVHVGASVRYRSFEDESVVRYRARPGMHLSERFISADFRSAGASAPFVDGVESDLFWGIEAAGVFGPFHAQGEYTQMKPDLLIDPLAPISIDDPTFKGWYAEAGFFLTGESRAYKGNVGEFDRVKVKNPVNDGGLGAWQVAVRYDRLDYDGADTDGDAILDFGGEQSTITGGVNWHLNNYTRLMFNYVRAKVEDSVLADDLTAAGGPDPFPGDEKLKLNQFGVRAQVDW